MTVHTQQWRVVTMLLFVGCCAAEVLMHAAAGQMRAGKHSLSVQLAALHSLCQPCDRSTPQHFAGLQHCLIQQAMQMPCRGHPNMKRLHICANRGKRALRSVRVCMYVIFYLLSATCGYRRVMAAAVGFIHIRFSLAADRQSAPCVCVISFYILPDCLFYIHGW